MYICTYINILTHTHIHTHTNTHTETHASTNTTANSKKKVIAEQNLKRLDHVYHSNQNKTFSSVPSKRY